MRKFLYLVAVACLTPAAPAAAQNTIPGLENFTLERPQPPAPTATPTPVPPPAATSSPTATASPAALVPQVATRRPLPQPRATAAGPSTPAPPSPTAAARLPAMVETPAPIPVESPPPAVEPDPGPARWPLWAALAGTVLAGLAGFAWWRRRKNAAGDADDTIPVEDGAAPARPARTTDRIASAAPPPSGGVVTSTSKPTGLVTSSLKPEIQLSLIPARGGVDTLRATLEFQLHLANAGRGAARAVAVEAWLISASHQTEAELATLFSRPPGEPMLPPFDLPASAAIDLTGLVTAPRDALATITAGERRMFVPVLAVRVEFADGRGLASTTTGAFLVGVERAGQARLAPLPLDRGARMHERLAARPYDR